MMGNDEDLPLNARRKYVREHPTSNGPYMPEGYLASEYQNTIDPFIRGKNSAALDYASMADYLQARGYIWDIENKEWYQLWQDGIYRKCDEDRIKIDYHRHIKRNNGGVDRSSKSEFANVLDILKSISNTDELYKDYESFVAIEGHEGYEKTIFDTPLIPTTNGIIDADLGIMLPQCACIFNSNPCHVEYENIPKGELKELRIPYNELGIEFEDPEKEFAISTFEQAYANIIPDGESREYYYYWLGSVLFDRHPLNHILILGGRAKTGKTALTIGIEAILEGSVSKCQLHQLTGTAHGTSALVGKRLNITNEIEDETPSKKTGDLLKMISDGGIITINEKYKPMREVRIQTRLMMTGNRLPEVDYSDTGLVRRFKVILCNNIQDDEYQLHKVFASEIGKNWLFNRCYQAWRMAKDLRKTPERMVSLKMIDNLNSFMLMDPFNLFLNDYCGTIDTKNDLPIIQKKLGEAFTDEVYRAYCEIAEDVLRVSPLSPDKFSKKLRVELNLTTSSRKDFDGRSRRKYVVMKD